MRRPPPGLLFHSDRGIAIHIGRVPALLEEHHVTQSLSRPGQCWDNAVGRELVRDLQAGDDRGPFLAHIAKLRSATFAWIEGWYNLRRRHSALGYLSPLAYETVQASRELAT